jgi:hypothetical protein
MKLDYNLEESLEWDQADRMFIQPPGWKQVTIEYIDSPPYIFWRLKGITGSFMSNQKDVLADGAVVHFSKVLIQLKNTVLSQIDQMDQDKRRFYEDNLMRLFA